MSEQTNQLATVSTDALIAELMTRFEHAVFCAWLPGGTDRWEFRGNYLIAEGLGARVASRVSDARRKAEAEAACASP